MRRSSYSKHAFYGRGKLSVDINKNRTSFMKHVNEELLVIYDSCVDFIISIYKDLEDVDNENCFMVKAYELLKSDIEKDSYEYMKKNYSNVEKFSYEDLDEIIQSVFDINYKYLMCYCRKICIDFMNDKMRNFLSDSSEREEFAFLSFYDPAFLKMFKYKFEKLAINCLEFVKFTDDSMTEECFHHIVHLLKPSILKTVNGTIKEFYGENIVIDKKSLSEGLLRDIGIKIDYIAKQMDEEVIEEEETDIDDSSVVFTDDYKELNRIAEENGFSYVRCNGDHGIFKSENGMVVIPQGRSIGKGLSIKIQKNINRYKAG